MSDDNRDRPRDGESFHDLMRDRLPDLMAGTVEQEERAALEARLESDADFAAEAELVRALRDHRPEPPAGFGDRITASLEVEAPRRRWGMWQLSTAAVLVLSLGTALLWGNRSPDLPNEIFDEPVPAVLPMDDGLVAGAALLEDLSDAALEALLEEMGG